MVCEVDLFLFRTTTKPGRQLIDSILDSHGTGSTVVVLDGDAVFSKLHLSSAVMHAARSILKESARARDDALEVIRWLTGSHQVSRGIELAAPGDGTDQILVAILPASWPKDDDGTELPSVNEKVWEGPAPEGLEPVEPPFVLGGEKALEGSKTGALSTEEKEKMILEKVSLLGLR